MHESPNNDGKPRVCRLNQRIPQGSEDVWFPEVKQELSEFLKSTDSFRDVNKI
jgi:hypothetical protein